MKQKYIDKAFPPWFIFGEKGDLVDIATLEGSVISGIKREHAEALVKERDRLQEALYMLFNEIESVDLKRAAALLVQLSVRIMI